MEFVSLSVCAAGVVVVLHSNIVHNWTTYCLPFCCCRVMCISTRWQTCLVTPNTPPILSTTSNWIQLKLCKTTAFTAPHRQGYHWVFIYLWRWLAWSRSRIPFPMGSMGFFIDIILTATLWPWGRLNL